MLCRFSDCIAFRALSRDILTGIAVDITILTTSEEVRNERCCELMALVGLLEDNARIAKMSATMLHYLGHEVTVYAHARDCFQALLIPDATVDRQPVPEANALYRLPVEVLILDLHLPDIDGVEVLWRLRSHPHTRSLPLIFCTAATPAEIARARRIAPHARLVTKPFKIQTLTSAINNALVTAST